MVHHMVDGMTLDWMAEVRNVFQIRHPARVVAIYLRKRQAPKMEGLGFWHDQGDLSSRNRFWTNPNCHRQRRYPGQSRRHVAAALFRFGNALGLSVSVMAGGGSR